MHLLQRIDALLELNVVRGELGLAEVVLTRPSRAARTLLAPSRRRAWVPERRTLSSTWPTCSLTNCPVRAAQGVKELLSQLC